MSLIEQIENYTNHANTIFGRKVATGSDRHVGTIRCVNVMPGGQVTTTHIGEVWPARLVKVHNDDAPSDPKLPTWTY